MKFYRRIWIYVVLRSTPFMTCIKIDIESDTIEKVASSKPSVKSNTTTSKRHVEEMASCSASGSLSHSGIDTVSFKSSLSSITTGTANVVRKGWDFMKPSCLTKPKEVKSSKASKGMKTPRVKKNRKYQKLDSSTEDEVKDQSESIDDQIRSMNVDTVGKIIMVNETIETLCHNQPHKSKMWMYFEKQSNDSAKCKLCLQLYKLGGGTTNLHNHMKLKHPDQYKPTLPDVDSIDGGQPVQHSIKERMRQNFNRLFPTYKADSEKNRRINVKLLLMIARDFQPFSIVDDKGFRDFVQELNPRYKICSRKYLTTKLLPELFAISVQELHKMLETTSYIAITCDGWTSTTQEAYLGITCHFILENPEGGSFELMSATLYTVLIKKDEKSETLKTILESVFNEWSILSKISCMVTDNAANMKKTAKLLGIPHLGCFAHSLNLIIKNAILCRQKIGNENIFEIDNDDNDNDDSFESLISILDSLDANLLNNIQRLVALCKKTVTFFHSSPKAMRTLREIRARGENSVCELVQQFDVRWNTLRKMLVSIVENYDFIRELVIIEEYTAITLLKRVEIDTIREFIQVLTPFEDATEIISGERYVTLSSILPCIKGISFKLESLSNSLLTNDGKFFLKRIRFFFEMKIEAYESQQETCLATLLDPRFKKIGFRNGSNAETVIPDLCTSVADHVKVRKNEESQVPLKEKEPSTRKSKRGCNILDFLDSAGAEGESDSSIADAVIVVDNYLRAERTNYDSSPLTYWFKRKESLEYILPVFLKYFCIPGSSVPCERLFSRAGYIVTARRNRLMSENVQMLTVLNTNYELIQKYFARQPLLVGTT